MTNFFDTQERARKMGYRMGWSHFKTADDLITVDFPDCHFCFGVPDRYIDALTELCEYALDGLDADARARRCVKRIFADIPPPASGAAADIVAEEFGIEEAK